MAKDHSNSTNHHCSNSFTFLIGIGRLCIEVEFWSMCTPDQSYPVETAGKNPYSWEPFKQHNRKVLCKVVPMTSPRDPIPSNGSVAGESKPRKITPTVCRLGAPRKCQGECNTFDKLWVVRVDYTEHQISIRRKLSQKLVVKYDGQTLLDKRYVFSKPTPGHCFVAWTSVGVSFSVFYQAATSRNLRSIRTSADHYELLVDGVKFSELQDGFSMKAPRRRPLVENALKRLLSIPLSPSSSPSLSETPDHSEASASRDRSRTTERDRHHSRNRARRGISEKRRNPRRLPDGSLAGRARSVNFLYGGRGCYSACFDDEGRRDSIPVCE